ncbi:MAG: hypothetical protein ABFD84_12965 [Candidatus Polarisedimenticolia bacterium]|nr:hypothetical protein [bacterium]
MSRSSFSAVAAFAATAAVVCAAGCASSPTPVFERAKSVGPSVLVLVPQVRTVLNISPVDQASLTDQLSVELRRTLAGASLEVKEGSPERTFAALRGELLDAIARARLTRSGRFAPGTDLGLGPSLAAATDAGARAVVVAELTRLGAGRGGKDYVPIPPGELVKLPEDRPDFIVPQRPSAAGGGSGVELRLLVVDAANGHVLAHRVVVDPAMSVDEIRTAMTALVREACRGLIR